KFLRHIPRTRLLVHCVSLESSEPMEDYQTVRAEISAFESGILAKKQEVIVLTKSDTRDSAYLAEVRKMFEREGREVLDVTVLDDESIKAFREKLVSLLRTL
ncbi:MAG: hypothetical protein AAB964_01940, partial [Patescibacteria group bacterium]